MAYKGTYRPKNKDKYDGDASNIKFRSLWERQTFRWCDDNPNIRSWHSEETIVPYRNAVDGKVRRYFVDLKITWNDGSTTLVEIKPSKQTRPPTVPKRKTRRYLNEAKTFAMNVSKWEAAKDYAEKRGWKFEIWTENHLKSLGIKIYGVN